MNPSENSTWDGEEAKPVSIRMAHTNGLPDIGCSPNLAGQTFERNFVGNERRQLTFGSDGLIVGGSGIGEIRWRVDRELNGRPTLIIGSEKVLNYRLTEDEDGVWRGPTEQGGTPVELTPQALASRQALKGHVSRKISYCITCMGRAYQLRQTLPLNLAVTAGWNVEFVVLDYNSNDGLGDWIKAEMWAEILAGRLVYGRTEEPTHFNMPHAKNLSHCLASGNILCNLDADNFLAEEFTRYLDGCFRAEPATITQGHGNVGFAGRVAIGREWFFKLGGYDEQMGDGWGYEDQDLVFRGLGMGLKLAKFPDAFALVLQHSNEERTINHKSRSRTERSHMRLSRANMAQGRLVANGGNCWGATKLLKNFHEACLSCQRGDKHDARSGHD